MQPLESAIALVFPQKCLGCGARIGSLKGFCGECWPKIGFIGGKVCDGCGVQLAGEPDEYADHCDRCLEAPPPWSQGRAALYKTGMGGRIARRLRGTAEPALIKLAGDWMRMAAQDIIERDMIIAPQPLSWAQLLREKQSALAILGRHIALKEGLDYWPDLLALSTGPKAMQNAAASEADSAAATLLPEVSRRYQAKVKERKILLIADHFEPSAAQTHEIIGCVTALERAGAKGICVIALAHSAQCP